MQSYLQDYPDEALDFLKQKDRRLACVIEQIGRVEWRVYPNLFESVVFNIVGQQLSNIVGDRIWKRLKEAVPIEPEALAGTEPQTLRNLGMSMRKAEYIVDFANKVRSGEFSLEALREMSDEEAIKALCRLRGIGRWTAEMLLLGSLARPDILSFDDYGIRKGMCMVYGHKEMDRKRFERYRKRLSPHGSIAAFYFWAVAGGAIPELGAKK